MEMVKMADVTVTVLQNFPHASIKITDDAGNPARVDGVPVWSSSDESVLKAVAAADGMTALVDTVGPGVDAHVTATADADLGAGVVPLVVVFPTVTVLAGTATVITGDLGTPADKAPTPPPVP
jgi:hypothetical protein